MRLLSVRAVRAEGVPVGEGARDSRLLGHALGLILVLELF